jgi:hypothetical protein
MFLTIFIILSNPASPRYAEARTINVPKPQLYTPNRLTCQVQSRFCEKRGQESFLSHRVSVQAGEKAGEVHP